MRKIAQKGMRSPKVKASKVSMAKYQAGGRKKAQDGTMKTVKTDEFGSPIGARSYLDLSETNVYKGKPGLGNKMKSALYEGQPWVKATRANELRKSKMSGDELRLEKENVQRRVEMARKNQEAKDKLEAMRGGQQRRGGKTKKAQAGAKTKKVVAKPKAKYGVAKKASSKRSK